jgi:hypothetical protein
LFDPPVEPIQNPTGTRCWRATSSTLGRRTDELHEALSSSTLITFTEAEGADWHCEPAAHSLRDERVFNWLEPTIATR